MKTKIRITRIKTDVFSGIFEKLDRDLKSNYPGDFLLWGNHKYSKKELLEHRRSVQKTINHYEEWRTKSKEFPVFIGLLKELPAQILDTYYFSKYTDYHFYIYHNALYAIMGPFSDKERKLLVVEEADKEERHFKRIEDKTNETDIELGLSQKQRISERVRIVVWRRDEGKCRKCGSKERLEFDHIVPRSLGGSNTARNVELLCEKCNRIKGADVA